MPADSAQRRPPPEPHPLRTWLLLVALATIAVAGFAAWQRVPLGTLNGATDEWFFLGVNLAWSGSLGYTPTDAVVYRAPGYPAFIALVLHTLLPGETRWTALFTEGRQPVYLAQVLLLAATAAALAAWLSERIGRRLAVATALVFALNPYSVLLPGLMHYDVLHIAALVLVCWVWQRALVSASSRWLLATGVAWGLTTLVRPVSLTLPPFALVVFLAARRPAWGRALREWALVMLAMGLTVLPWTLRNYALTGQPILVNRQGWIAIWGSSVKPRVFDPNRYQWDDVVGEFTAIFREVTGAESYSYWVYARENARLEQAFRERALENLRERPGVYLHNVAVGLGSLLVNMNSGFIDVFVRLQQPGARVVEGWHVVGRPQDVPRTWAARGFDLLVWLLTPLAALAVWTALRRRDTWLLVPGATFACLGLSHALVYMDLMYYYFKLPFLLVFAAWGLDALDARSVVLPGTGRAVPLGEALGLALATFGAVLTVVMLSA